MKAIWNDEVIAESDKTVVVEGNHYFPLSSANEAFLKPGDRTSICPWKGAANYYTLRVAGAENLDAAWHYAKPKEAAQEVAGRVAFGNGIQIIE
jgi:uncharacterized protein (DUF427 family)